MLTDQPRSIVTRSTHGVLNKPSTTIVSVEGDTVVVEVSGILRNLRLPRALLAALLEEAPEEMHQEVAARTDGAAVECPECDAKFGAMVHCPFDGAKLTPLADASPIAVAFYEALRKQEAAPKAEVF